MTEPKVVVPWRPDGGRLALWDFCSRWWKSQGVTPVESPSPAGRFNRSAAINAGLGGDWAVAVVIDADVFADREQIDAACDLARSSRRLVFAFDVFVGLAPWGTRTVLDGGDPATAGSLRIVRNHESSILAIPRSVWDAVGGFDERFVGWGQDDVAFCQAARVLTGEPGRVAGPVFHLWHEAAREKRPSDAGWQANQALGARYRAAVTPETMRDLLCERNALTSSTRSTARTDGTASTA